MKSILSIFIYLIAISNAFSQITLSGTIKAKGSSESLIGASLYFLDLKAGCISNEKGEYSLSDLPEGKFWLQVKFVGYRTFAQQVDLHQNMQLDIELEPSSIEVSEIVITGSAVSSDITKSSVSIASINRQELKTNSSTNMVNMLTKVPGISAVTTGQGISKPVIRGLGYNHVVSLSDGIRQEGSQWGDEHGIELDQFSVERVEILKGPASLLYGSDALGGVVNVIEPLPLTEGLIQSDLSSQYSTNNGLIANSLQIQGNNKGWIWKARGTYKNAASYSTPTERIYNSGFNELNFNAELGIRKSWGYSHLNFSRYDARLGMVEGARDSATGRFVDSNNKIVTDRELNSRVLALPFQKVEHTKLAMVNNFIIGHGQLKTNLGLQSNQRLEYAESTSTPGLQLDLKTMNFDLHYQESFHNNTEIAIGISGMGQNNKNKGTEFLVPNYQLYDIGGFIYAKKTWDKVSINGGARYDSRKIDSDSLSVIEGAEKQMLFKQFETKLAAFSGALGLTYQPVSWMNLKLNIGRGYRAPNIAELAANGVHEGTFRYEIGNKDLQPETSLQFDGEISMHSSKASFTLSAFYNTIDNFIYQRNINGEMMEVSGSSLPVYRYVQGNSVLKGFEMGLDVHFVERIHFESSIAYVHGSNTSNNKALPLIPAMNTKEVVRWDIPFKNKIVSKPFCKIGADFIFKQNRYDEFETETKAYSLIQASIGADLSLGKLSATLFINGENLGNRKYYDHLKRLKYNGIYNMGRNITVGLNIQL